MINETQQKDKFLLYAGITVFVILAGILMVKQPENKKFAPINQQAEDETALMNIRVLS